jgi:isohexenylglutaconyl-CoA hydratase
MELPAYSTILTQFAGGVLRVLLNRPQVRNAMSMEMVGELADVLKRAETSHEVRAIVLSGKDGHFCAGGDIRDMAQARARQPDENGDPVAQVSEAFGRLCAAYATTDIAVICVIEGSAMGGGFGLACVADIAIAAPSARFGLPETRLGLVPAQIAPFLVERLGYSAAKLVAVLGGNIHAQDAFRLGLVHEVADDPEAALSSALNSVLQCAPGALAATKRLLREARHADPASMSGEAARVFAEAVRGGEGTEGAAAFLQKRKPVWAVEVPAKGDDASRTEEGK